MSALWFGVILPIVNVVTLIFSGMSSHQAHAANKAAHQTQLQTDRRGSTAASPPPGIPDRRGQ